jgi:hypothetical protein
VNSAVSADNPAHLTRLEREGSLLEGLLHLTLGEPSEIPTSLMGRAIRVLLGQFGELLIAVPNLSLVAFEDLDGLFLGTSNSLLQ